MWMWISITLYVLGLINELVRQLNDDTAPEISFASDLVVLILLAIFWPLLWIWFVVVGLVSIPIIRKILKREKSAG